MEKVINKLKIWLHEAEVHQKLCLENDNTEDYNHIEETDVIPLKIFLRLGELAIDNRLVFSDLSIREDYVKNKSKGRVKEKIKMIIPKDKRMNYELKSVDELIDILDKIELEKLEKEKMNRFAIEKEYKNFNDAVVKMGGIKAFRRVYDASKKAV